MSYTLFILLNAVLFIRPAELVESLDSLKLYQVVIAGCLLASYPTLVSLVSGRSLREQPATCCVLGLLGAIVVSHLQFGSLYDARMSGADFLKIVVYYLLLIANLNTPRRYQRFLTWFVLFTLFAASLALLQYHNAVNIPALEAYQQREIDEATGEVIVFARLCGTGMFNDPNDVCLLLVVAMMICLYRLFTPGLGRRRAIWWAPLGIFFWAFLETKSRGGFIALMVAVNVLLLQRVSWRRALATWIVCSPASLLLLGGRMTRIEMEDGTGQHRIQLWREALGLLRDSPVFGIGQGMLPEYMRFVAHNSYVHAFAELGMVGGSCFVSLVVLSIVQLYRLKSAEQVIQDAEMRRLRAYLLALVCGFCTGIVFLSRMYVVPTYMVFGLAAAYLYQARAGAREPVPLWRMDSALVTRLAGISVMVLVALELGSRILVRWE